VRRSPKALEKERKAAELIEAANASRERVPERDRQLIEVIEDPAYRTTTSPRLPEQSDKSRRIFALTTREWGAEDSETYQALSRKIRPAIARQQEQLFYRLLDATFIAIARSGAAGPLEPDPIPLPDPPSFRRLVQNPDGTGRIEYSPLKTRFEEFEQVLQGPDLTRIRECPSCDKLFWAKRKDQVACSTRCANRVRFSRFYNKKNRTRRKSGG
jgi:hypothetical protein